MRNVFAVFLAEQRGRFPLLLPVCMAAGIVAYFDRATEPSLRWSIAAFACPVAFGAWARRWPAARASAVGAAFGAAGFLLAGLATARAPGWAPLPRHAAHISGTVAALDLLPRGRRVTLASPSLDGAPPLSRALRLRLRDSDTAALTVGDQVRVRALVQPPSPPAYPGGRDAQRDAFFAGIDGYGFAIGPVQRLLASARASLPGLREAIAQRIMLDLPGVRGAVAATLLTGIGTAIPASDRSAFDESGLAHLLAVAGLHIGIVMGLVFAGTRFLLAAWEYAALAWPTRKIAALAALIAGGLYLALTGAHVPILRSFGMASLYTLGVLTGRRALSMRGLALAAIVLMMLSPVSVVGVSFQMSFAAVLCLIAGYELLQPALARMGAGAWWRRPTLYAAGLTLTSLLAGTASLPFAMYHFGQATLYYVPANMLAVPLTAFWIMPWGLAALALMPFGLDPLALAPMGWGIAAVTNIARAVSAWPDAILPVAQSPAWGVALVALGLAWTGIFRGGFRLAGLAPLLLGLAAPLLVHKPDILVGPDARLIAVRLGRHVAIEGDGRISAYDMQAPLRLWGVDQAGSADAARDPHCGPVSCRVAIGSRFAVIARAAEGIDCSAAVVVSSVWLHGACPKTAVVDHGFVGQAGATTIRLTPGGAIVTTDRQVRGDRPWVIVSRPSLPMAATE